MKPDKIKIEDLEVFANHGVFPEENVLGQKFVVSAVMYTDTRRAGLTDELTASIPLWRSKCIYHRVFEKSYV